MIELQVGMPVKLTAIDEDFSSFNAVVLEIIPETSQLSAGFSLVTFE